MTTVSRDNLSMGQGKGPFQIDVYFGLAALDHWRVLTGTLTIHCEVRDQDFSCGDEKFSVTQCVQYRLPTVFELGDLVETQVVHIHVGIEFMVRFDLENVNFTKSDFGRSPV